MKKSSLRKNGQNGNGRFLQEKSKEQTGSTIAQVMAAFALLIMAGAAAAQVMMGARRLVVDWEEQMEASARLQRDYYLGKEQEKTEVWQGDGAYFRREALDQDEESWRKEGFWAGDVSIYRYEGEEGKAVIYHVEEE